MGASLGTGGGTGRRRYRKGRFTEINVTPMVDVMLVLLIIFMVTAPLLTAGVHVDLPQTSAQQLKTNDEPVTVSIEEKGGIYINDNKTPVTLEQLIANLKAIVDAKNDTRVYVRGDKNASYGTIMHVMGAINEAGISKVALITEQTGDSGHHRGK
jgi:biopolymer transport protein TolR